MNVEADNLQLKKNIEELMMKKELQKQQNTITASEDEILAEAGSKPKEEIKPLRENSVPVKTPVHPIVKQENVKKAEKKMVSEKKEIVTKPIVKKPKAIMMKREERTNDY
jgi:hypothetical protein